MTTMDLVFGDAARAEAAVQRLNSVHASVRGAGYRALDPELLLWVQTTLIVTSVEAYARWVGPLSDAQRDQFWDEARSVGTRLGIPLSLAPADWSALMTYWKHMLADDGPIHATEVARRMAPMILRPPLPLPAALIDLLGMPGLALLPARLRDEFGITWTSRDSTLANALSRGVRVWTSVVPGPPRWMPQARRAYERIADPGDSTDRPPSTRRTVPVT
jgi:uncharacterized protein (DUF2236 family)